MKTIKLIFVTSLCLLGCTRHHNQQKIVQAFVTINSGMSTSHALDTAIQQKFAKIETAYKRDPKMVQPYYMAAQQIMLASDSMVNLIEDLKLILVTKEMNEPTIILKKGLDADSLLKTLNEDTKEDFNTPTRILMDYTIDQYKGWASFLKATLARYRKNALSYIAPMHIMNQDTLKLNIGLLLLPIYEKEEKKTISWEEYYFANAPLVADMVELSKLQNDVRRTELNLLSYLVEWTSVSY
jgi:hypothetical protein